MPNKTQPTTISAEEFVNNYPNQKIIPDCLELIKIFESVTGQKAVMWGNMIGFGFYHYKYESGREGDSFAAGFAPSKIGITIYTNCDIETDFNTAQKLELLPKLGKYKASKACLYIKKLADIDLETLKQIINKSYKYAITRYV